MPFKLKRIVLYTFLILNISISQLVDAETVKITNGEWPPFLSKNYKNYGLASHIVSEAFKASGVTIQYRFLPWARALDEAKSGKISVASVVWTYNEERAKDFHFSDPVFSLKSVFFHKKDIKVEWNELADLSRFKIGGAISYNYGPEFTKLEQSGVLKVSRIGTDLNNLKKLISGRIDLYPTELEVGYEMIKNELSSEEGALLTNSKPFRETNYHLIFSKNYPHALDLVKKFNAGLTNIKSSGQYEQMISDNLKGHYSP